MIIHGINPVLEALNSGSRIIRFRIATGRPNPRIQQIIDEARSQKIPVVFEPREALDRRAGTTKHQSVLAEISQVELVSLERILEEKPVRVLLLDGVEDPHNLGAVLRSAEGAGISAVLLPGRHSCGITPTVVKTSAGAALHLRIGRIGNLVESLKLLKQEGYRVVGLDMRGSEGTRDINPQEPLALVIGGEDRGLRRLVRETCDFLVRLPMRGQVTSLNLSVAAGILFYQLLPQPTGLPGGGLPSRTGKDRST